MAMAEHKAHDQERTAMDCMKCLELYADGERNEVIQP